MENFLLLSEFFKKISMILVDIQRGPPPNPLGGLEPTLSYYKCLYYTVALTPKTFGGTILLP